MPYIHVPYVWEFAWWVGQGEVNLDWPMPVPINKLDSMDIYNRLQKCAWLIYSTGPDNNAASVWGAAISYDATNGTTSFGDVFRCGERSLHTRPGGDNIGLS